MANGSHPPAELHERLLICRTIKLNAGAHGGHRRCCHAQMQKKRTKQAANSTAHFVRSYNFTSLL